MNAWGAAELSGPVSHPTHPSGLRPSPSSARTIAGGHENPPRVPIYMNAWGAAELSSARTIAGGHGNPPRVPI
jgi:hypothetical protein